MKKKSIKNILMLTSVLALGGVTVGALTACEGGETTGAYSVTIEGSAGAVCTPSATSADAGTTITLTFTVSDGYQLQTVSVVDENGASVAVAGTGTTWTFVMPSSSVKVSYVCQTTQSYSITLSYTTADVRVQSSARSARGGTTITLSLTLGSGKYLNGVTVTGESGTNVAVNGTGTTYSFIMPAENVTVTIATGAYEYTVTVADVTGVTVTTNLAVGQNPTYNTPIEVTVVANDPSSTAIIGLKVLAGSTEVSVEQSGYGVYSFRMPASNITISPVVTQMTEDLQIANILNTIVDNTNGYALAYLSTGGEFYSGGDASEYYYGMKEFSADTYLYQKFYGDSGFVSTSGWHNVTVNGEERVGDFYYGASGATGNYLYNDDSVTSYLQLVPSLQYVNQYNSAYATAAGALNYWDVNLSTEVGEVFAILIAQLFDIPTAYTVDSLFVQATSTHSLSFLIETSYSDSRGGSATVNYQAVISAPTDDSALNIASIDFSGVTFADPTTAEVLKDPVYQAILDHAQKDTSYSANYTDGNDTPSTSDDLTYDVWYVGTSEGQEPYIALNTTSNNVTTVQDVIFFDNDNNIVEVYVEDGKTQEGVVMTAEKVAYYMGLGATKDDLLTDIYNASYSGFSNTISSYSGISNPAINHIAETWTFSLQSGGTLDAYMFVDWCDLYGVITEVYNTMQWEASEYVDEYYFIGYGFSLEEGETDASEDRITLWGPAVDNSGLADGNASGFTFSFEYTSWNQTSADADTIIEEYLTANPGTDAGETPAE